MSEGSSLTSPALLQGAHAIDRFDCGDESLNGYLKKYALINNQNGASRTYVTTKNNQVVGYYTLTPGSVSKLEAPQRIGKGLANYPVPVVILARLATDKTARGTGLGKALLWDALVRIVAAADSIGGRAILVHAKNERAKSFYEHFGFEPSPIDPLHMYLLIKDVKKTLGI
ncbi:GNAT family N-acetyltransferase [Candidatus Velamenicoccus archaeovorus]|uniref:GNAT family N-acetyltransferase n=1 Tax=Velamenicoccus archaeovorus TaxID=1930593 RepID=A0A410P3I1_VELA1|nr:GNAT family N-acetyltransferase [Candidatus Velamenicoccus archaeovorus]QAT16693.1 GNAT family N-acetyltransferase [Candidatus Velamenicoccus archaeovorus]